MYVRIVRMVRMVCSKSSDLLLIDINLPYMNGFELYEKISKLDLNVKVCSMSAGEVNHEAIREIHPSLNIGCFMQKSQLPLII
jgi:two-component SAPR family response regulator